MPITVKIDRPSDGDRDYHIVVDDEEHSTGYICARASITGYSRTGEDPSLTLLAMIFGDSAEIPDEAPGDAAIGEPDPDNGSGWIFSYIPGAVAGPSPGEPNVLAVWAQRNEQIRRTKSGFDSGDQLLAIATFFGISAEATECDVMNSTQRLEVARTIPEPNPEKVKTWHINMTSVTDPRHTFTGDAGIFQRDWKLGRDLTDPDDFVWSDNHENNIVELRVARHGPSSRVLRFVSKDQKIQLEYSLAVESWTDKVHATNRVWPDSFQGLRKPKDAARSVVVSGPTPG